MKAKDILLGLIGLIALILLWAFIDEKKRSKLKDNIIDRLTKENEEIKSAYLGLLEEFLKEQPEIEPSILRELQRAKSELDELDTSTHIELNSIIRHVASKEYAKGVRDLTKIVEVKLKEKVEKDVTFKKQKKLHFLLEHAKHCKWITNQEFENAMQLKEIRNKESHELNVQITALDAGLSVFAGIKVLYAIARRK